MRIHGILQARILEWVAMPSSRGSSQPRDRTHVSYVSCIGRQVFFLPLAPPGKCRHRNKCTEGRLCKDMERRQSSTRDRTRSQERPPLLTPRSQISSLQNCEKINFCHLSHVTVVLCYASLYKPIHQAWHLSAMPCSLSYLFTKSVCKH